jgi:hypothetical protein
MKGHSQIAVEMYKGWQIIWGAGGPGSDTKQPVYYARLFSRRLDGQVIETNKYPRLRDVQKAIDAFQNSEFSELPEKTMIVR